ncbi:pyroglutamyl-peptidase I [Arcanobacterium hippocoleae]
MAIQKTPLVLVTGFEPFGGERENASWEAVKVLQKVLCERIGNKDSGLVTARLPVEFVGGPAALRAAIAKYQPSAVVCVGEAGGRSVVTPERFGRNLADARIPDNSGAQPRGQTLDGGDERILARVNVDALAAEIAANQVPVEVSEDAGTYVCNAVLRALIRDFSGPGVFIHIPALRRKGRAHIGDETDSLTASRDVSGGNQKSELTFADIARMLETAINFLRIQL